MKFDQRRWLRRGGRLALSLMVAAIWILPLYWMFSASLRRPGTPPPRTIEWWPLDPSLLSYSRLSSLLPLDRLLGNSLLIVGFAVPVTLISASWAGLALSQLPLRWRRQWIVAAILLLMVPGSAVWLPRFVLFANLGLIDTFWVLVLPALMGSSPLFVLLFYWSFRRIPGELFDAARIDGAGTLRLWASVGLPLVRPTLVTVAVLAFTLYWSDFVTPLLYLKSEQRYPMAVGLQILQQLDSTNWSLLMAGAVVLCAPVIGGFLLVQRYFWSPFDP